MPPGNDTVFFEQDLDNLYRDHHHWLLTLLQRRLGNRPDAADLAHDVFVRLLKRPQSFTHFDDARAYLSTMAKGLCIDLWRRRDIEQAYLDALASQPEPIYPSAEQQAIVVQALWEINNLLLRLPAKAANAFVMAVIQGHTDKDVAQQLGISDRMVRKYVARVILECAKLDVHPNA